MSDKPNKLKQFVKSVSWKQVFVAFWIGFLCHKYDGFEWIQATSQVAIHEVRAATAPPPPPSMLEKTVNFLIPFNGK